MGPEAWREDLFKSSKSSQSQEILQQLLEMSGFPEPFFANSLQIKNIWARGRMEKIVREDLRDLSRIPELSQVEMLVSLLPERVGSPLSVQNLSEDLEVSHGTINRWLSYLQELYYFFRIQPWTKSVPRSLKKEPKIYLFDWTEAPDLGQKFENLIASHLQKACHYWTDTGRGNFGLHYVKNKEKQEIDFLLSLNKSPWLLIEVKMSDQHIDKPKIEKFTKYLGCPFVQVVFPPLVRKLYSENILLTSATNFLAGLP